MNRILVSVCSRKDSVPVSLNRLEGWIMRDPTDRFGLRVAYDAPSIYEGHASNINIGRLDDSDIIVLCHDDIEILSDHLTVARLLEYATKPNVGFLGVAGATTLMAEPIWWNSRTFGNTRGMVFQGKDLTTMTPNYFGESGQVVVLDGCFLAASAKTLKEIKLEKPSYINEGNWDFYDIHLTSKAFLAGKTNWTVPILIKHESPGEVRVGWFRAKQDFKKEHCGNLPLTITKVNTNGYPV